MQVRELVDGVGEVKYLERPGQSIPEAFRFAWRQSPPAVKRTGTHEQDPPRVRVNNAVQRSGKRVSMRYCRLRVCGGKVQTTWVRASLEMPKFHVSLCSYAQSREGKANRAIRLERGGLTHACGSSNFFGGLSFCLASLLPRILLEVFDRSPRIGLDCCRCSSFLLRRESLPVLVREREERSGVVVYPAAELSVGHYRQFTLTRTRS